MTCKLLHHHVHKGGYSEKPIDDLAHHYKTRLWIQDFCALYMSIIKSKKYAPRLLQAKLYEKSNVRAFELSPCYLLYTNSQIPYNKYTDPALAVQNLPYILQPATEIIDELVDELLP